VKLITLMLAVNDHRNGMPDGLCRAASLSDPELLSLESPHIGRHLRFAAGPDWLHLGRHRAWPHYGEIPWPGNWCWNAYRMDPGDCAGLLNFLVAKGYTRTVASDPVLSALDAGRELTAGDLCASAGDGR